MFHRELRDKQTFKPILEPKTRSKQQDRFLDQLNGHQCTSYQHSKNPFIHRRQKDTHTRAVHLAQTICTREHIQELNLSTMLAHAQEDTHTTCSSAHPISKTQHKKNTPWSTGVLLYTHTSSTPGATHTLSYFISHTYKAHTQLINLHTHFSSPCEGKGCPQLANQEMQSLTHKLAPHPNEAKVMVNMTRIWREKPAPPLIA